MFWTGFAQEWDLKKNKNGIRIYTRSFDSTKIREYKAIMTVKTTLQEVFEVLMDGDRLWEWNYKTSESKTLVRLSDEAYIVWIKNDLPWPIKNRDHVSRVMVVYRDHKRIRLNIVPDNSQQVAEESHTIRITNFKGYWLLREIPEGIEITQQLYGDPGGALPAWLLNSLITTSPYQSFSNLKEILEK